MRWLSSTYLPVKSCRGAKIQTGNMVSSMPGLFHASWLRDPSSIFREVDTLIPPIQPAHSARSCLFPPDRVAALNSQEDAKFETWVERWCSHLLASRALGMHYLPWLSCLDKEVPVNISASKHIRKGASDLSCSSSYRPSKPEVFASSKQKPVRFS